MLARDHWREVWQSLRRDRLRTVLTGSSVAWGVFLTVILLGAATGLRNGVAHQFRGQAIDSVWLSGRRTTAPFAGQPAGRTVQLRSTDAARLPDANPAAGAVTAMYTPSRSEVVAAGGRGSGFPVRAVEPGHRALERSRVIAGRFINEPDLRRARKVAVLGAEVASFLFGDRPAVGQTVVIGPLAYRVVGVFDDDDPREARTVYIPLSTAQRAYAGADVVDTIAYSLRPDAAAAGDDGWSRVQRYVAARHRFDPRDDRALRVHNAHRQFRGLQNVLAVLTAFVWSVGLLTVVAGMIGVSNIVFISVAERRRELAVRKAIGASPASILALVVREAVVLSCAAGGAGLAAGLGLLALVRAAAPPVDAFRDPAIAAGHAAGIAAAIVACGVVAGLIPAVRAARVRPAVILEAER